MVVYNLSGLNLRSYPIPSSVVTLGKPKVNLRRKEGGREEKDCMVRLKVFGGIKNVSRNQL